MQNDHEGSRSVCTVDLIRVYLNVQSCPCFTTVHHVLLKEKANAEHALVHSPRQSRHTGGQNRWRQKGRVVYTAKTGRRRGPCQEQQGPQHECETCTLVPRAAANPSTHITVCPTSTNRQNVS